MSINITIPSENPGELEVVAIDIKGDFEIVTDRLAKANDNMTGWEILYGLMSDNQITIL